MSENLRRCRCESEKRRVSFWNHNWRWCWRWWSWGHQINEAIWKLMHWSFRYSDLAYVPTDLQDARLAMARLIFNGDYTEGKEHKLEQVKYLIGKNSRAACLSNSLKSIHCSSTTLSKNLCMPLLQRTSYYFFSLVLSFWFCLTSCLVLFSLKILWITLFL